MPRSGHGSRRGSNAEIVWKRRSKFQGIFGKIESGLPESPFNIVDGVPKSGCWGTPSRSAASSTVRVLWVLGICHIANSGLDEEGVSGNLQKNSSCQ